MKTKGLVLFSGGLDSRLTIKLLQEQGLELELLHFVLPFGGGCCNNAACVLNFSQVQCLRLNVIDLSAGELFRQYIKIIRFPRHGTGSAMNPCRDCRIFMFNKAREFATGIGAKFIATGEVLGQRPMSQLKDSMFFIEKQANLVGKILRPLSAQVLPPTEVEKQGLVDRNKLLGIVGRQRTTQLELAAKYQIKFPTPGGGCSLCEPAFSTRLTDLFSTKNDISPSDVELIKTGRHFRSQGRLVVGRTAKENDRLESLNGLFKYGLIPQGEHSPTVLFESPLDGELATKLRTAYSHGNSALRADFDKIRI